MPTNTMPILRSLPPSKPPSPGGRPRPARRTSLLAGVVLSVAAPAAAQADAGDGPLRGLFRRGASRGMPVFSPPAASPAAVGGIASGHGWPENTIAPLPVAVCELTTQDRYFPNDNFRPCEQLAASGTKFNLSYVSFCAEHRFSLLGASVIKDQGATLMYCLRSVANLQYYPQSVAYCLERYATLTRNNVGGGYSSGSREHDLAGCVRDWVEKNIKDPKDKYIVPPPPPPPPPKPKPELVWVETGDFLAVRSEGISVFVRQEINERATAFCREKDDKSIWWYQSGHDESTDCVTPHPRTEPEGRACVAYIRCVKQEWRLPGQ